MKVVLTLKCSVFTAPSACKVCKHVKCFANGKKKKNFIYIYLRKMQLAMVNMLQNELFTFYDQQIPPPPPLNI